MPTNWRDEYKRGYKNGKTDGRAEMLSAIGERLAVLLEQDCISREEYKSFMAILGSMK